MLGLLAVNPVSMMPISGLVGWGESAVVSVKLSVCATVYSLLFVSELLALAGMVV